MSTPPDPDVVLPRQLREPLTPIPHEDGPTEHLAEYLRHTLICLKRYVARHAHRMLQSNGTLNDLYVSFHEAHTIMGAHNPASEEESVAARMGWPTDAEIQSEIAFHQTEMAERTEAWKAQHAAGTLPIENLRQLFHLTERQVCVLAAAAAPLISIDLSRLYAFAWADFSVKNPSVGFIAELLAETSSQVPDFVDEFRGDSPLIRYRLIELGDVQAWGRPTPMLHQSVRVPNRIVAYLQGSPEPLSVRIADTCQLTEPESALQLDTLVIEKKTVHDLTVALRRAVGEGRGKPRLLMVGGDGVGRSSVLRSILAPSGWGVLTVDLARLIPEGERFEESLVEICREALLRRCLLLIRGGNLLADRAELTALARPLCRVLEPYEGLLALTSSQRAPLLHRYLSDLFEVTMPLPSAAEQRKLWTRAAHEIGCRIEETAPDLLTQRFSVSPGAIYQAVEEARARAALFSQSKGTVELRVGDLGQAIRRKTVHALGSIAQPFATALTWDDVVLPEDVLRVLKEILSHARHREKVYDDWGFGKKIDYGRGLSCLFSGPPGTGKTMMSAVLAQTLGREIYRVDISQVVSKWVGETEKNLSLAFDEAERGQLILLFDEADSLFSKRTQTKSSHDRFANMEINYLLQRMEAYDGMTILTSNKEKAIDEAFKRRIKFKLNFPMPDAELRSLLWQTMIPEGVSLEDDIPYEYLGKEFEMAGGHIKNAVVRAAFYAAEDENIITTDHLYKAALQEAREMGMVVRDSSRDV